MNNVDDVLSNMRCAIGRQNLPGLGSPEFFKHVADSHYVFFYECYHPSHFFIMDTFNEDVQ